MAFDRPQVTRGRITVPARSLSYQLMFNPNDVKDAKGVTYGAQQVPGASHPVLQYGSGGERVLSFVVHLDGDRGRLNRLGTQFSQVNSLSVAQDIRFFQSLLYPSAYNAGGFPQVAPHTVLFTMGEMYQSLACIVKKAEVTVNYWSPKMEPIRADIALELSEVVTKSVVSAEVYRYIELGDDEEGALYIGEADDPTFLG